MKEIFENKYKLYLFSILWFLFLAVMTKVIPNIEKIFLYVIFPLSAMALTFFYAKKNGAKYEIPIVILIIYMLIGYFFLGNLISLKKVMFFAALAILGNYIDFLFKKYILKEKIQVSKIKKQESVNKAIPYLLPIVFILILEIYYRLATFKTVTLNMNFPSLIIGLILIYSIFFIITFAFKSTHKANIFFSILFLIVFIINQMRIFYTSDAVQLTDVQFINTTGELKGFVDVTLVSAIKYIVPPTIITLLIFGWLWTISKKNEIKIVRKEKILSMIAIPTITLLILFLPIKKLDEKILNIFYNYGRETNYAVNASITKFYEKYGVVSGLYGKFIERLRFVPKDYNEEELKKILNNVEKKDGTWGKPNVIVVFSESFWDVSQIEGISFDKDIQENFHKLSKEGKLINMISPSYGGISANVEFEILTGGSLNYFSKGYVPYMQLYKKGRSENNPSVIKEFSKNGYHNIILNSSSRTMFNCEKVYDIFEVDERYHLHDEINLNGNYVSDDYLVNQIINYFDNKDKDEKTFYFAITMGGHMPYYKERYEKYDFNMKSKYNDDINGSIMAYAEGMYLADQSLGKLYNYIQTLEENTIVVFFGDHLPYLQTVEGKDSLFETNYLNTNYNLDSMYRQFNTRALILSNYDIDFDETEYLSPDLLLTYVMNNMDLELSSYYKWLYTTKDSLPASNPAVSIDKNGTKHYTMNLNGEMKDTYELRKKMQYMLFK